MLKIIAKTLKEQAMLKGGEHLLIAVSGGPDSVALLHAMQRLAPRYDLSLTAAHLNHGLRAAESDRDEAFVRELCTAMGVRCICRRIAAGALADVRGHSLEEASREARYRFLLEVAEGCRADKIATGHHRDDQAETLLINLLRGSGVDGLKGILPVRDDRIIRPLIDVDRARIISYLESSKLPSVQDSSNDEDRFLRNRIRRELVPLLTERYNPQLAQTLSQTAKIMRRESDCLQQLVQQSLTAWGIQPGDKNMSVPLQAFGELHEALQGRIIKSLTAGWGQQRRGIAYRHVQAVLQLIAKPSPCGSLHLPGNLRIEKRGDHLTISQAERGRGGERDAGGGPPCPFEVATRTSGTISLPGSGRELRWRLVDRPAPEEMRASPQKAFIDFDCIRFPLVVRHWLRGDRMVPLGMAGGKKLADYFVDRKIGRTARRRTPLLVDACSVIWIAGERISERVKVTQETRRVLTVEMI